MAMDLIASPTAVSLGAPASSVTRTPDSDPETPPPPSHPFPKWVLQNHHHAPPEAAVVSYKECLKNHAASIGGHALDGCCEFMPGPTANPSDPTSLKCAACGCHRNFHRRDPDDPTPLHQHLPAARRTHSPSSASQLLLSLSGHGGQSPSGPPDEMNPTAGIGGGGLTVAYYNNNGRGQNGNCHFHHHSHSHNSKKRFRTKFSQEQKDKMYEFSQKIGWKLRRGEEKLVEDFCKEVGVGRGVFKVWMHNNKHSSSSLKKEKSEQLHQINNGGNNNNGDCSGVVHDFYTNGVQEQEQAEQ